MVEKIQASEQVDSKVDSEIFFTNPINKLRFKNLKPEERLDFLNCPLQLRDKFMETKYANLTDEYLKQFDNLKDKKLAKLCRSALAKCPESTYTETSINKLVPKIVERLGSAIVN